MVMKLSDDAIIQTISKINKLIKSIDWVDVILFIFFDTCLVDPHSL